MLASLRSDIQAKLEADLPKELERILPQAIDTVVEHRTEIFSGPLPHPDNCRQYEDILPGFTDRALKLAENAQATERSAIQRRDWFQFLNRFVGTAAAFIVVAGGMLMAYVLLNQGHDLAGISAMIVSLATLAGSFIAKSVNNKPSNK
jgi:uncharacterized membrane protein